MPWLLVILSALALALLHWGWRRRLLRAEGTFHRQMAEQAGVHEREIAARDARQQALMDSMVEGLVVLDNTGRIRLANRAFQTMFGTAPDPTGKTLLETVRHHDLLQLVEALKDEQRQIEGCELKLPEDRWIGVSGAALFDPIGASLGKLLVFHDLTRLKKLERMRQEFVANVSHELRTPLSMIKGYAETLLNGAKDDPAVATRFLQTIDRNAERLSLLIEDLLTLSELEANRIQLNLQHVEARALVEKVFGDLAPRARNRGVRLANSVPEITILADPLRAEQVFINLIDNAIKYGGDGGTVEVRAHRSNDQQIEFSVIDNGRGISGQALERIFERFYREDKARSRVEGGTGLGLAIVKHIVQSHGGKVWAESTPGRGATFHFSLFEATSSHDAGNANAR